MLFRSKQFKPSFVEIETNGTIAIPIDMMDLIHFNISPKEARFQPQAIKQNVEAKILKNIYFDFIVKFVYSDVKSRYFIYNMIRKYRLHPNEIWIMPEGKSRKELEKLKKEVWEFCIMKGFNYSPRLHIDVFNTKRGV